MGRGGGAQCTYSGAKALFERSSSLHCEYSKSCIHLKQKSVHFAIHKSVFFADACMPEPASPGWETA